MREWRWIWIVVLVFLCLGCSSVSSSRPVSASSLLRGTPPQNRAQLLKQIPIGTPRKEAERIAASIGLGSPDPPVLGTEHEESIRYQHPGKKGWFVDVVTLIQIECSNGLVTDIFCEKIYVGP